MDRLEVIEIFKHAINTNHTLLNDTSFVLFNDLISQLHTTLSLLQIMHNSLFRSCTVFYILVSVLINLVNEMYLVPKPVGLI